MNGLLLVAHVDKLFDSYQLSFDPSREGFRPIHPRVRQEVTQLELKRRVGASSMPVSYGLRMRGNLAGTWASTWSAT